MSSVLPSRDSLRTLLDSLDIPRVARDHIEQLAQPVSVEFHRDLFLLLRQFRAADLERFAYLWSRVDASMRSAFVAFVVTGDDPDGRFLSYLDESQECQEAVDLAFAAHIDSLHDLGKSLSEAGEAVSLSKVREIASLLSETERAEDALESAEDALESIKGEPYLEPVLHDVQAALSAVGGTKRGLRVLAGIED